MGMPFPKHGELFKMCSPSRTPNGQFTSQRSAAKLSSVVQENYGPPGQAACSPAPRADAACRISRAISGFAEDHLAYIAPLPRHVAGRCRSAARHSTGLLGHASSEVTRQVYLHAISGEQRRAVKGVEKLVIGPKRTQCVEAE
jgi:hypothetical protein